MQIKDIEKEIKEAVTTNAGICFDLLFQISSAKIIDIKSIELYGLVFDIIKLYSELLKSINKNSKDYNKNDIVKKIELYDKSIAASATVIELLKYNKKDS